MVKKKQGQTQTIYNDYDRDQVLAYLKKQKAKKKKRRRRILFVMFIIGIIVAFFASDYSRLQSISVSGNNLVGKEEIIAASKIKLHQDITFFTDMKDVQTAIENTSLIKEAKVSKDLFGHVTIKVVEADPIAQCTIDNVLYVVDETGRVTKDETGTLVNYVQRCPKLNGFNYERFVEFSKQFAKIPTQIINQISDINYTPAPTDETHCDFIMDDGKILYVRYDKMAELLTTKTYYNDIEKYPEYKYFELSGRFVYRYN